MSVQLHGHFRTLGLLLLMAALGFMAGMAAVERASAGGGPSFPADLELYTYQTDSCSAGEEKDPINIVFVKHGFKSVIKDHAEDHGGWEVQTTSQQYFGDEEGCFVMDGAPASNCGCNPFSGRYHMRHYNHREQPSDEVRTVPFLGSISSAAAHHEDVLTCGFNPLAHAVDDMTETFVINGQTWQGGFNAGREDVLKNWVINGNHIKEYTIDWDNVQPIEQCDHTPINYGIAMSDGNVYYVRAIDDDSDSDADGCFDASENQSKANADRGGGRNPSDRWDFYDVSVPLNGKIDLFDDIVGVINHYAPLGDLPGYNYNVWYDRGPPGKHPWTTTAPDGKVDLFNDIVGVINQYGHQC